MSNIRVRYHTYTFNEIDVHVRTLRDRQQFADDDGEAAALGISSATWPIFGVVYPAGEILARLMATYPIEGRRILEVGCGIALASLVLSRRGADITATDRHPAVPEFLAANSALNGGTPIPFVRAAWEDEETELGRFDLIIASDVLYEHGHVDLLADFIDRHAASPSEVIVVDPGRGNHARFSKRMVERGFTHEQRRPTADELGDTDPDFTGRILHYTR